MKEPLHAHRALTAGLSAGACVALPVLGYVATLPFDAPHAFMETMALPFAVGGVVGVGACAMGMRLADGAQARSDQAEGTKASEYEEAHEERPFGRRWKSDEELAARKGVPVIARAQNALSEEEAWADIDVMLSGDSPVSCDAARSKDIYEIALEEMARTNQWKATDVHAAQAGTQTAEGTRPAQAASAASGQGAAVASSVHGMAPDATSAFMVAAGVVPAAAVVGAASSISSRVTERIDLAALDLDEPSSAQMQPIAQETGDDEAVAEVPVADYSGHEDMWAQALAILAEDEDVARAMASLGESADASPYITAEVAPGRMEAIAEGARATGMHAHVNELLEKEFDKAASSSMRATSKEYLRVIQGGTMAMPKLSAEA